MQHSSTWTQNGNAWTALLQTGTGHNMQFRIEGKDIDSGDLVKAEIEGWSIFVRAMENDLPPVGTMSDVSL